MHQQRRQLRDAQSRAAGPSRPGAAQEVTAASPHVPVAHRDEAGPSPRITAAARPRGRRKARPSRWVSTHIHRCAGGSGGASHRRDTPGVLQLGVQLRHWPG
jgi:hypothetical protein